MLSLLSQNSYYLECQYVFSGTILLNSANLVLLGYAVFSRIISRSAQISILTLYLVITNQFYTIKLLRLLGLSMYKYVRWKIFVVNWRKRRPLFPNGSSEAISSCVPLRSIKAYDCLFLWSFIHHRRCTLLNIIICCIVQLIQKRLSSRISHGTPSVFNWSSSKLRTR